MESCVASEPSPNAVRAEAGEAAATKAAPVAPDEVISVPLPMVTPVTETVRLPLLGAPPVRFAPAVRISLGCVTARFAY